MPVFEGNQGGASFTPSATQNWVLFANDVNDGAQIMSVDWSGHAASSLPSITRWVRPTTAHSGTATAIGAIQAAKAPLLTPNCQFVTLATPGTIPASPAALKIESWNAFGGLGRYNMDDREMWEIANVTGYTAATQIICINDLNTTINTMSCGVCWIE